MSVNAAHTTHVYSYADRKSAAAGSSIVASWRRCITVHGLAPDEATTPMRLTEGEFNRARDEAGELIASAGAELDRLFSTVGKAGCCILLTDKNGIALERRGVRGDDKEFHDLGLWTGSIWTEASVGTNGIGTAIADERAINVFRDQHFLCSNIGLSCATAPIRDQKGRVAAALDIYIRRDDVGEVMFSLLSQTARDAAMRIELNLFRTAFAGSRLIMLPSDVNSVALLAVDKHDMVVGATRAARFALRLDDRKIERGLPAADALQEPGAEDGEDLAVLERAVLLRALSRTNSNVSRAATALGMSRATLHRKLKKVNLQ
ncbi:helix-turn-helix domain-containing protein [Mesorhizobium sp. ORM8.1]